MDSVGWTRGVEEVSCPGGGGGGEQLWALKHVDEWKLELQGKQGMGLGLPENIFLQ